VNSQQVVYLQHQQTYPGAQGGMIIIQPSGAMTTMPQGYPVTAQQQGYLPHQVNMSSFHKSIGYLGFLLVEFSGLFKTVPSGSRIIINTTD